MHKKRQELTALYHEYPQAFWILTGVSFIDRLGGALLYPFFTLYITSRFKVGMTEAGLLFGVYAVSAFIGSVVGGALTDRLGRKGIVIFSLIATSLSNVVMGLVDSLAAFYGVALLAGIFTDVGGPAHQAMVADMLPEEKRAQGFGILRVAFNLAVTIGPVIGGFIAARSYLALFLTDAVISLLVAGLVFLYLPETKPAPHPDAPRESLAATFRGYARVLQDRVFVLFTGATLLMVLVYMNMNTTLGVYLREAHGVPEAGYGYLLSLNAAMVVLFQFWITRRIQRFPPMLVMAAGAALYAIGFAMYGFVSAYALFLLAMAIITVGEMIVMPVAQALSTNLAPEAMRGRYLAVYGFSWGVAYAIGPYLAGRLMDSADPRWLWYAAGLIGLAATLGFILLHRPAQSAHPAPAP